MQGGASLLALISLRIAPLRANVGAMLMAKFSRRVFSEWIDNRIVMADDSCRQQASVHDVQRQES